MDTAIPSSPHRIPFRIAKLSLTGPFSTGVGDHLGSSWCCIFLLLFLQLAHIQKNQNSKDHPQKDWFDTSVWSKNDTSSRRWWGKDAQLTFETRKLTDRQTDRQTTREVRGAASSIFDAHDWLTTDEKVIKNTRLGQSSSGVKTVLDLSNAFMWSLSSTHLKDLATRGTSFCVEMVEEVCFLWIDRRRFKIGVLDFQLWLRWAAAGFWHSELRHKEERNEAEIGRRKNHRMAFEWFGSLLGKKRFEVGVLCEVWFAHCNTLAVDL